MFTGIIEQLGTVRSVTDAGGGRKLAIAAPLAGAVPIGASVAVNGACLTVVASDPAAMVFEAGPETLDRTNLGLLRAGDRVNLERALAVGDRLGGHWVQGHVDTQGTIDQRRCQDQWEWVWVRIAEEWTRQMVPKGSVTVDGVSLTVVAVEPDRFSVALIPHTLDHTTLGDRPVGSHVNIETDILGKYVVRAITAIRDELRQVRTA